MKMSRPLDKAFTVTACVVFGLVTLVLVLMLMPIVVRGAGAVFFRGTVEFRRYQLQCHGRGRAAEVEAELAESAKARQPILDIFNRFRRGLDTEGLRREARRSYRKYGAEVRYRVGKRDEQRVLCKDAREMRNALEAAFESTDTGKIRELTASVLHRRDDPRLKGTACETFFALAQEYRHIAETTDLTLRQKYLASLQEIEVALKRLLGPFPGEPLPALRMDQYGATRMDRAEVYLDDVLWAERWVSDGPRKPLRKIRIRREEQFAGTDLARMFPYLEKNLHAIMRPRRAVYWQYFIDDSIPGHFFGGVGPEIVGTLLLTVLAILVAMPLGIVAAAYITECAGDNLVIMVIRTCINTLAGVPSIVFGLFGLAFFVLRLLPWMGVAKGSNVLAGSLTLAVLVLPIIIRASEEAIRSVPHSYKEAALSLGASRFRTFMTVILPAALPGILTGAILSMSRAAGETAPILFTAAVAMGPVPHSIFDPTRTLSYGSYDIAVGDKIAPLVPHQQYGMVMTLVALVLILNLAAILLRARISRKLRGA